MACRSFEDEISQQTVARGLVPRLLAPSVMPVFGRIRDAVCGWRSDSWALLVKVNGLRI